MARKPVESISYLSGMSISQLASLTGLARETVRKRLVEAGLQPSDTRKGHAVYRPREALPALYQMAGEYFDPDRLKPLERHAHYKAEREKLHLQMERGDVVPSIEVEQKFAGLIKILTQGLETLPDVVERDVGATPVQLARIERAVDELRDALYQQVVSDEDDADGSAEKRA
jgi:uncharacterized protein HemX